MNISFILYAGVIAYSGPFVPSYRAALLSEWGSLLAAAGVPASKGSNLVRTLADPVKVSWPAYWGRLLLHTVK
jgi:dynein heavy chain